MTKSLLALITDKASSDFTYLDIEEKIGATFSIFYNYFQFNTLS